MESQLVPIKDSFSKGLVYGYGRNKIGTNFCVYTRNARINNKSTTIRPGYKILVSDSNGTHIRGIIGNEVQSKILVSSNSRLKYVNLSTNVLTDIGALAGDGNVNMFNHGKYTIILTGSTKPYVYDGTTLTLLTTTSPDVNPKIGCAFSGFTVIAGNTSTTNTNIYFSRPVTPTNPEYAYDRVGSGSEKINIQSEIVGLVSSLNNLFIFSKRTIEVVGKDSLSTIGGTASLFSSPIGEGDELINERCVVSANDKVFYMTKNFEIKTLNYIQGTIDPAIGQLSERPLLSISSIVNDLNTNQTDSFAIRKEDKIFWYLKSINSSVNDICLIYDITNDSRLVDNDMFFACMTKYNNNYYAGSYLNSNIYQDNVGNDDDGLGIPFEYRTVVMSFGNPVKRKFFKGWELAGEINRNATIKIETLIDGKIIDTNYIYGNEIVGGSGDDGIGGSDIGGEPIGGDILGGGSDLVPFERVNDSICLKGKNIQLIITCETVGAKFYFDYLSFFIIPIGSYILSDKL